MDPAINEAAPHAPRKRAALLAIGALLLALGSVASYPPLMEVAWVRSSAAPVWVGFGLAAILAVASIRRDRRIWVRGIAGMTLAFIAFGLYAFFVLARLPQSHALAVRDQVPALSVVDHRGQPLALRDAPQAGPVLLVFYRGFW